MRSPRRNRTVGKLSGWLGGSRHDHRRVWRIGIYLSAGNIDHLSRVQIVDVPDIWISRPQSIYADAITAGDARECIAVLDNVGPAVAHGSIIVVVAVGAVSAVGVVIDDVA